jgi:hypothetical protein
MRWRTLQWIRVAKRTPKRQPSRAKAPGAIPRGHINGAALYLY